MKCRFSAVVVLCLFQAAAISQPMAFSILSNGDDHLHSIDLLTGATSDLGLVAFGDAEGLAGIGNQIFAIGGTVLEFWDVTSPPGTLIGPTGPRSGVDAGLDYDATTGTMYNLNASGGASFLYTIDVNTGTATLVGTSTVFSDGLAINAAGQAYGTDFIFADGLYSVDLTTGAMTFVGSFGLGNVIVQAGASFDSSGVLWAITSAGLIYTIDTTTGLATFISQTAQVGWEGLHIPTSSVGALYQVNQPGASLDVNAVIGNSVQPATVMFAVNQAATLTLSSTGIGQPWDVATGLAPLVPVGGGALTFGTEILNVNVSDPTFTLVFGLFQGPGFANSVLPISFPNPTQVSVQLGVIAPASPVGFALSQPSRLVIQ